MNRKRFIGRPCRLFSVITSIDFMIFFKPEKHVYIIGAVFSNNDQTMGIQEINFLFWKYMNLQHAGICHVKL